MIFFEASLSCNAFWFLIEKLQPFCCLPFARSENASEIMPPLMPVDWFDCWAYNSESCLSNCKSISNPEYYITLRKIEIRVYKQLLTNFLDSKLIVDSFFIAYYMFLNFSFLFNYNSFHFLHNRRKSKILIAKVHWERKSGYTDCGQQIFNCCMIIFGWADKNFVKTNTCYWSLRCFGGKIKCSAEFSPRLSFGRVSICHHSH